MDPAPARPEEVDSAAPESRRLAWGLAALLVVAAWRWGGLRAADGPYFAAAAAFLLLEALGLAGRAGPASLAGATLGAWSRDIFFWGGLLFIAYLGCQWWNAGRELVYDPAAQRWLYAPPRHPGCPWAIARPEAAQMLHWFFPAWALGLAIRSPRMSRRGLETLVLVLLASAGTLAAVGLIEVLAGVRGKFWHMPPGCDSFASFGYGNHAAAYFVLAAALAAGMLFREGFRRDRPANKRSLAGWIAVLFLCLTGANLSLSRTGVVLAGLLSAAIVGYGFIRGWRVLRPAARFRWAAATAAGGVLLYFAVAGSGGTAIRSEFALKRAPAAQLVPGWQEVNLDLSDRPRLWKTAWQVFKENPVYGTGGWGFRHLAAFHLPAAAQARWNRNVGRANVHCDPLQFLTEFGLAGTGALVLALGALLAPLCRRRIVRGAVFTFAGLGLALTGAFSWIDLPFRCPAILWTWTALLAALPKLTAGRPDRLCDVPFHSPAACRRDNPRNPQP